MSKEAISEFLKLAPKVSQFKTASSYQIWKKSIHTLLNLYVIPEENLLSLLEFLVRDEVGERVARAQCKDAAHFWDTLDNTYGKGLHCDEADNFFALINPPRTLTSVKDYISYFDEYMHRIDNDYFSEKGKIALFLSPLSNVIADAVRTQHPTNVEETQRLALASGTMTGENIFRPLNHQKPVTSGSTTYSKPSGIECFYCHRRGHTEYYCKKKRFDRNAQIKQSKDYSVGRKNKRYEAKGHRQGFIDISDETKN